MGAAAAIREEVGNGSKDIGVRVVSDTDADSSARK
jgi:hypothetical protein